MDSPAEFWREPNSNAANVSGSPPMQVLKDSINTNNNNDRTGNGRRSSDGGPPPFNRTRSFKSKQLVRSQAIRESQSPPRGPSPRPDSKEIKMSTVKMKSASVDLDDRLSFDNNSKQQQHDLSSNFNETALQKKSTNIPNDAISLTNSDSFKNINISCNKNILVPTSGDKKNLGANVVSTPSSPSECKTNNNETVNSTTGENSIEAKNRHDKRASPRLVKSNENAMQSCEAASSDNSVPCNVKCLSVRHDDSHTVDIDSNKVLDYSENNNDNECLSLDIRTEVTDHHHHHHYHQSAYDTQDSSKEYHDESDSQNLGSDTISKKQRVSLKNLKNTNFIKNRDSTSPVTIYDNTSYKNKHKVEFHQVEIQVTSGDNKYTNVLSTNKNEHDCHNQNDKIAFNRRCDCGIGHSLDKDEIDPEELSDMRHHDNEGRRAICPSKQDSGVCCWDSFCGDISPEIITSDTEEEPGKMRKQKTLSENDNQHCNINETCRCSEKGDRWTNRRNGSMLTVQRANSGGNPRLLRKQSSAGSVDSGQHSISSPFLSRDNSTDLFSLNPCDPSDLPTFIKDTLNKSQKDRIILLKLEHDMIAFVRDPTRREHRFPAASSYGRLLVHRCADLFGLRHGLDAVMRHIVCVTKLPPSATSAPYRIPLLCPFQQWCTAEFRPSPVGFCETIPQAKSILKRDTHSLDEEAVAPAPAPPKLVQTPRSKSFEQREEEYVKARRRIFSSPGQEECEISWDWEENREHCDEPEICTPRILVPDSNKSGRLLKVQSLEQETVPMSIRGVVSKAHSFGGYGGRQGIQRDDSISSTSSAPPHRILSRQGELASTCWRLSPSSSGYKTLSRRSDSVTPSPTSTPNTTTVEPASGNRNSESKQPDGNASNVIGGVLWAISDMSTVPTGAVIIHPQTGQALTNSDGSLYHYDPEKPPHSALLPHSQVSPENVRVLSNSERRRCRLEKQRATLSPGTEIHHNPTVDIKNNDQTINTDENSKSYANPESQKPDVQNSDSNLNQESTITIDVQETNCSTSEILRSPIPTSNQKPFNAARSNHVQNETVKSNNVDFNDNNEFHSSKNNNRTIEPLQNYPEPTAHQIQQIKSVIDTCNSHFKNDFKAADLSPVQFEHFERADDTIGKIITCAEFESQIVERPLEEFIPPYSEEHDPRYYGAIIQAHSQQYYTPGQIYEGTPQELYPAPAQPLNYIRSNETSVPQHQLNHPHLIFAPQADSNLGYQPSGELCYPASPGQVLIPPPTYRLHEQESQPPYHVVSAAEQHQQPVMVALSNKMSEHEIAQQQLASYPMGYHQQVERVITAPPIVGVPAPHPTLGYQIQGASSWGCWPQMTLYASHQPQSAAEDAIHKFQQHAGAFIPQHAESPLSAPNVAPAIPQAYYPHPNFIQTQPNQYYPSYSQPTPIIQHQYPVYQQYNPGRSSVLSQEGCSTPGFQNYEQHFNFPKLSDGVFQENFNRSRANVKSPKSAHSRPASNSGSSRTTPLTTHIPIQGACDGHFPNVDPNINMNNIHFIHPAINYIPFTYPYANQTEFNCENQNRQTAVDNQNFIKYNKQVFKETEKFTPSKNISKLNAPLVKNEQLSQNVDSYPHDKVEKPPHRQIIQSDKSIDNTLLKNPGNVAINSNIPLDMKNLNRNKDKRKPFRPSNSITGDGSERNNAEINYEHVKSPIREKLLLAQNYHHMQQMNQMKPFYNKNNKDDAAVKKTQYTDVHKPTIASNLSNDAKTFIPKNQNPHVWTAKDNTMQNDEEQPLDTRSSWRKNQNYLQKDYHNFPKNLSRQNHRNAAQSGGHFERDKNMQRNHQIRERFHLQNSVNQRVKPQPSIEAQSPPQVTPTMLNSPATPWNPHVPQTPPNANLYNAQNVSSDVYPVANLNQPPPPLIQQHLRRLSTDSRASPALNTPSAIPKSNNKSQGNVEMCIAAQQRFLDANLVGIPFAQGAAFYQRTQALQNLAANGGLGLMPTPPLQPGYLLRQFGNVYQVPGALFRRPAAPALFGPAPPLSGQIRARPPRPHQSHTRHFYH